MMEGGCPGHAAQTAWLLPVVLSGWYDKDNLRYAFLTWSATHETCGDKGGVSGQALVIEGPTNRNPHNRPPQVTHKETRT